MEVVASEKGEKGEKKICVQMMKNSPLDKYDPVICYLGNSERRWSCRNCHQYVKSKLRFNLMQRKYYPYRKYDTVESSMSLYGLSVGFRTKTYP